MRVVWNNGNHVQISKDKMSKIKFKLYEDQSKEIHQSIKATEEEKINFDDETKTNDDSHVAFLMKE